MSIVLVAAFFLFLMIGLPSNVPSVSAQPPTIDVTNVVTPDQASQGFHGHVSATLFNHLNQTFEGYAQFTDVDEEIKTVADFVNFTIGYQEELTVIVPYQVDENATIGPKLVLFEINVGGFSFLYEQYVLEVIPVAEILWIFPGQVLSQKQVGVLFATIQNHSNHTRTVQLELFGSNFFNASIGVDLAPGENNVALSITHNASHIYDFGIFPVNLSIYYQNILINSFVANLPVDMSPLNKVLGIILPITIFLAIVLYYTIRKRRRIQQVDET